MGPVHAVELLELQPKAKIEGDVAYKALEMHQGAVIFGQLRPTNHEGGDKPLLKLAANNVDKAREEVSVSGFGRL